MNVQKSRWMFQLVALALACTAVYVALQRPALGGPVPVADPLFLPLTVDQKHRRAR